MWRAYRIWLNEAAVALALAVGVPALLIGTGAVRIAPRMHLVAAGWAVYVLGGVFQRDMRRGLCAAADLLRKRTLRKHLVIEKIRPEKTRFSVAKGEFARYYVLDCLDRTRNCPVMLVTAQRPGQEEGSVCTVTYYPLSHIILQFEEDDFHD